MGSGFFFNLSNLMISCGGSMSNLTDSGLTEKFCKNLEPFGLKFMVTKNFPPVLTLCKYFSFTNKLPAVKNIY